MLFIVSPAKKMNIVDDIVAWRNLPRFVNQGAQLAEAVRLLAYDEVKALWKCSDALACLNHERFQSMDVRGAAHALTPAIFAYEGIQYQNIAPEVMEQDHLEYLENHLRILSGLYGVLRPFDGVVPYRLEMQAKLCVGEHANLYEAWGAQLFDSLAHETDTIVNLASIEYSKAVVPFAESCEKTRLITCLFGVVQNDKLVQRSVAAKAARGSMVRWCAENAIEDVADLRAFNTAGYSYDRSRSTDDTWVFVQG